MAINDECAAMGCEGLHCEKCGAHIGKGDWPFCPHGRSGGTVIGDEVDYVDHNLGPEPIRIRSLAERRRIMRERGLVEFVRHVPVPGSDRSPHTTDWSKGSIDAYTLASAAALVSRGANRADEHDPPPDAVANPFNFTAQPEQVRDLINAMKDGEK